MHVIRESHHPARERVAGSTSSPTSAEANDGSNTQARGRPRRSRSRRRSSGPGALRGGAAGFGGRLASARDRERARDRNREERARVEGALADAPMPGLLPAASGTASIPSETSVGLHSVGERGCPVCSHTDLTFDDVRDGGRTLRLGECLRCDHRWTERPRRAGRAIGIAVGGPGRVEGVGRLSAVG